MAIETKTIYIRQGNKADLKVAQLLPGEQVLALDTGEVGIKSTGGDIIWYATTAGTNRAIPYSEKGTLGGVPQLTATDFGTNKILKNGTSKGVLTAATFDDFATGVQSGFGGTGNGVAYAKFPNGFVICYGRLQGNTSADGFITANLPVNFVTGPYPMAIKTAIGGQNGLPAPLGTSSPTSASFWYPGYANTAVDLFWVAFGTWK